jgi:hypothetical protein
MFSAKEAYSRTGRICSKVRYLALAGDLLERDYLTCLHRSEGGFCLLFSDLPELI